VSQAATICDALKAHIDAGVYTIGAVTSQRVWAPKTQREDMQSLQVLVVGDLKQTTAVTRGGNQNEFKPLVMVQKAVNPYDNATVDALVDLVEELEARVLRAAIAGANWQSQTEAELSDVYLWEVRAFVAAFEVTYLAFD